MAKNTISLIFYVNKMASGNVFFYASLLIHPSFKSFLISIVWFSFLFCTNVQVPLRNVPIQNIRKGISWTVLIFSLKNVARMYFLTVLYHPHFFKGDWEHLSFGMEWLFYYFSVCSMSVVNCMNALAMGTAAWLLKPWETWTHRLFEWRWHMLRWSMQAWI